MSYNVNKEEKPIIVTEVTYTNVYIETVVITNKKNSQDRRIIDWSSVFENFKI